MGRPMGTSATSKARCRTALHGKAEAMKVHPSLAWIRHPAPTWRTLHASVRGRDVGAARWRRLAITVSVAAVLAAMAVAIPLTVASAADSLLSQGKPATASSMENAAANPASAAFDGSTTTRWSSQFSDPQWIQVDLGATATISQVILQWESAYG